MIEHDDVRFGALSVWDLEAIGKRRIGESE